MAHSTPRMTHSTPHMAHNTPHMAHSTLLVIHKFSAAQFSGSGNVILVVEGAPTCRKSSVTYYHVTAPIRHITTIYSEE